MTHTILWDEERDELVVIGRVPVSDFGIFRNELEGVIRNRGGVANWHAPLIRLIATINTEHSQKIDAIKLWRFASRSPLKEAKDYIEAVVDGREPAPSGHEHPDISDDNLAWFLARLDILARS